MVNLTEMLLPVTVGLARRYRHRLKSSCVAFFFIIILFSCCDEGTPSSSLFHCDLCSLFLQLTALDQFRGDHAAVQKLVFVMANMAMVLLALLKCHSMGLLPTSPSDWLQFIPAKQVWE